MLIVSSCNKAKTKIQPSVSETSKSENELIQSLKLQTDAYTGGRSITNLSFNNQNAKWNWKLINADLKGALEGGAAGAGIGGAVGGPGGAVIGAVGGGLIGGIASSLAAATNQTINVNAGIGSVVINNNNPFDYLGKAHNEALLYAMNNKSTFYSNDNLNTTVAYNYAKSIALSKNLFSSENELSNIYSLNTNEAVLGNVSLNEDYLQFTSRLYQTGKLTIIEKEILDQYFTAIFYTDNNNSLQEYSISFENTIINSNLNELSKSKLLTSIAISRYSGAFWDQE